MLFALFIALAVVLAISAAIVATRRPAVALLQFAPAFGGLAMALTLPGHRNVPGSAVLLACCAALLVAAGAVHLRGKKAAAHG
jgi:hypothetical protein